MRIISGKLKGRKFELPSDRWKTRPTTDYTRENLFNILVHQMNLEDIEVLDLFAGTGAVGYEFISRGARQVTFVDKFGGCVGFIKKQLDKFDVAEQGKTVKSDVFSFIKQCKQSFDLIFADPPYALARLSELPDSIFDRKILNEGGLLIIEHDHQNNFENHATFVSSRSYGQTIFSFFSNKIA